MCTVLQKNTGGRAGRVRRRVGEAAEGGELQQQRACGGGGGEVALARDDAAPQVQAAV